MFAGNLNKLHSTRANLLSIQNSSGRMHQEDISDELLRTIVLKSQNSLNTKDLIAFIQIVHRCFKPSTKTVHIHVASLLKL